MSDDAKAGDKNRGGTDQGGPPSDEAFFARWSRRKQQVKTAPNTGPSVAAVRDPPSAATGSPATGSPTTGAADRYTEPTATEASQPVEPGTAQPGKSHKPLTEADFDDVDFNALSYGSDYGRFMQAGVPESIRQKALAKLWHSDPMFTAVDPFQDYAGDYTDAATVPKSGIVKTAYKVGQGFLSDDEVHAWHRLGKPPLTADMSALAVLVPGVRVRRATAEDGAALMAVHTSAIQETASKHHGPELAASWAHGLNPERYGEALAEGECIEIAVDEETGAAVAFAATSGEVVTALYVHANRARRGLGRALLHRALIAIRTDGHLAAKLEADPGALAFYEQQGFVTVIRRQTKSRGGLMMDVIDMEKLLVAPADLVISPDTPDQPEVRAFFAAAEAYMGALYPDESNHFVDASALVKPNVVFLVARSAGRALGCGAIVTATDGTAEIKRMWVSPEARGLKLGQRLLDALFESARANGVTKLQLETGISQPEALGLYRSVGFVEIAPFGAYTPDPLSVFMERQV